MHTRLPEETVAVIVDESVGRTRGEEETLVSAGSHNKC